MRVKYMILMLSAAVVTGLSSCVSEALQGGGGDAVRFGADIGTATRVQNDQWQSGDQIGIFMLSAGGAVDADIKDGVSNRRFVYNYGFRAADGNDIYYPTDRSQVDFVSYYPWRGDIAGTQFPVSVAAQSDPAAIDILYARTNGVSASSNAVMLTFYHKLSWLAIKVNRGEGMDYVNFSGMTASIAGMPVSGSLDLNTGTVSATGTASDIEMLKGSTVGTGYVGVYDALLIPTEGGSGRSVVFTVEGVNYTWWMPDDVVLTEGMRHTYIINISRTGVQMIGATITPWDEVEENGFADMFSLQLTGAGLQADLAAISANGVNAARLRILGGELTPADFTFMRNQMPNLAELDIKNATVTGDKIPDTALKNKSTLRKIILPESLKEIGGEALRGIGIISIVIPDGVKNTGSGAFHSCTSLSSVTLPEGLETIGHQSFYGCLSLETIALPNSLETIATGGLESTGLVSVVIPENVTKIEFRAFCNCQNLASVTCLPTTPPTLGYEVFYLTPSNLIIEVPAESVATYQTATNWSAYTTQIQAIP